jgi:RHS repeat-associated protein
MGEITRRRGKTLSDRFGYDARGNLVAAANQHVGLLREYDALDRLVSETDDRFKTAVRYVYDDASRLRSKVYPGGKVVHISYDAVGRPIGITDPFGDTTRYVYDGAGRRTETRSSSSGLATRLSYDTRGLLTEIASTRSDGSPAVTTGYPVHDQAGNRTQKTDAQGTTGYGYDGLHRLETVTPPAGGPVHYEYDGAGNRMNSGAKAGGGFVHPFRSYSYAAQGEHRLAAITDSGAGVLEAFPAYDAGGNPTAWVHEGDPRTLRWDALDRLVAIEGSSFSASYAYDPLGRRIAKTEQAVTTRYQYDGLDVVAEYGAAAEQTAIYVFGPGIDEPLKAKRGGTLAAYHGDGLGSVMLLSQVGGEASTTLASYAYDAFGEEAPGSGGSFANAYTFTGRERDASGLLYYRARYYLPRAGRFLTPDPLGLAGGINPYAYAASNPVNFTDPFGLTPITVKKNLRNDTNPVYFPALSAGKSSTSSQSVTGTFGVPVVPGAGSVRTELFIAAETTLGGLLAGDARGFDAAPNPSSSRAFFTLDFESGTGAYQINPTCAAGGGSCTSALPIGAGNVFETSVSGNSITVTGSLTNSRIIGPSIDFGIRFNANSSGVTFSGYRNAYPSYEITRGSNFLYRGAETHPLRLFDATGFVRFSGP